MTYEENLRAKAAEEQAKLSDGWQFYWSEEIERSDYGPRHWARWKHPDGFQVGEVDAGRYMATKRGRGGIKGDDGQYLEWSRPETAIDHINGLRTKS